MLARPSCVTLCNTMDCSPPGSSVHGILQARILEWVAVSFSRGSSRPKDRTWVSYVGREILYHQDTWGARHENTWKRDKSMRCGFPFFFLFSWNMSMFSANTVGKDPCTKASVQFSSVAQSCLTLYNPMDGIQGFPVHHQLPELTQTHVH